MKANEFRNELTKIMPGYKWTVHKTDGADFLQATGIQSSGFNRMSTLEVTRREKNGDVYYTARSSGFGRRAPWLHQSVGRTLARALRRLQDYYESNEATYRVHAAALQSGRNVTKKEPTEEERKAAFISELNGLLVRYNAVIDFQVGEDSDTQGLHDEHFEVAFYTRNERDVLTEVSRAKLADGWDMTALDVSRTFAELKS